MGVIHGGLSGSVPQFRWSHYGFVNELSSYIHFLKCDCSIRVTVLLEWLTALLEYLNLAFTE